MGAAPPTGGQGRARRCRGLTPPSTPHVCASQGWCAVPRLLFRLPRGGRPRVSVFPRVAVWPRQVFEILVLAAPKVHRVPMVSAAGLVKRIISQSSVIHFVRAVRAHAAAALAWPNVPRSSTHTTHPYHPPHATHQTRQRSTRSLPFLPCNLPPSPSPSAQNAPVFAPLLSNTVPTRPSIITVLETDSVVRVFQVMVEHGLSAVPIIDTDGRFVTPISISDVRLILLTTDFPLLSACTRAAAAA
jgi:hypothetical protein